jgi:hypothetical protein
VRPPQSVRGPAAKLRCPSTLSVLIAIPILNPPTLSQRERIDAGPGSATRRLGPADQWLSFALGQRGRVAPHPAPESLVSSTASTPLKLRLAHLEGLPLFQGEDSNFEIRVGVTLFDDGPAAAGGCFFGNTLYSPPVAYDMRKSRGCVDPEQARACKSLPAC